MTEDNRTVPDVVAYMLQHVEQGVICPCCGQLAKAYRRRIRGNHARFLMDVARLSTAAEPWVHYKDCFFGGRDYNYLAHFGLAETQERTGLWRVTPHGFGFIRGEIAIPDWILVYNNAVIRQASENVDIRAVLASGGFDYDALMNGEGS